MIKSKISITAVLVAWANYGTALVTPQGQRHALAVRQYSDLDAPTSTTGSEFECEFDQKFVLDTVEDECGSYVPSLEESARFKIAKERWEAADRFYNCTIHDIFQSFPDAPSGASVLVFRHGRLQYIPKPDNVTATIYGPKDPLVPSLVGDDDGNDKNVDFLPVYEDATASFFERFLDTSPCRNGDYNDPYSSSSSSSTSSSSGGFTMPFASTHPPHENAVVRMYQALDVAAHQYTRCIRQKPGEEVHDCTVKATEKLHWLPGEYFIYGGSKDCDSKAWSIAGVALGMVVEFVHLGIIMWKNHRNSSFSWVTLMVRLTANLGEPIVQAVVLSRYSFSPSSGYLIAAMEILQPTAAPLLAIAAGWKFSKGEGFQILVTDAVVTLAGMVVMFLATFSQINTITEPYKDYTPSTVAIIPVAVFLAIAPWFLVYFISAIISAVMQLLFMLACLCKSEKLWELGFRGLFMLLYLTLFVVLTPIWAIWEIIWMATKGRKRRRNEGLRQIVRAIQEKGQRKEQLSREEQRELDKEIFPLARRFRVSFRETSSVKRCCGFTLFWFFVSLSFVSFIGKWIAMVRILVFAGDAYCPSDYGEATFAGLGLKTGVLMIGLALQFFGLTQ